MPSFVVFPTLGLEYPSTIPSDDSLIDFEINVSVPAQVYLNGKYLGESPQKIRGNKDTKADIALSAENHEDFGKTISFKRNSKETLS